MSTWLRRILVIDDELARGDQASLFAAAYPLDGFQYEFAAGEAEAMARLEAGEEFALILLDLRFEGVGEQHGLEIYDRLISAGCTAPVVTMSSLTNGRVILEAWHKGLNGYVLKWSDNPDFHADLQRMVDKRASKTNAPALPSAELTRAKIRTRAQSLVARHAHQPLQHYIDQARAFKEELGVEWRHRLPFGEDFENYVAGWNASETELHEAEHDGKLLFLNMDFGMRCTLHCPHCFTMDGAIDERGRETLPYALLKERVLEAKDLGLKAVRILGRGEPTQYIARQKTFEDAGGDFLDFIRFLRANDITPLVFTRGQIIGNDAAVAGLYGSAHNIRTGEALVAELAKLGVSVFLGVSSIFPDINNEMTGRSRWNDYDPWCRRALALCVRAGLNGQNPTHLGVESPITTLNIDEMPVRYVLFQLLNISPCMNVYMVTGRVQALGLEAITDPTQDAFLDMYCVIIHCMRRMGIGTKLGPYAGTKECHDVSNGVYLTLNGDVYPCPGFDSAQSLLGSVRTTSLRKIWANNPLGRRPQSICVPKIASHFPPDFEDTVAARLEQSSGRYEDIFQRICSGLGVGL